MCNDNCDVYIGRGGGEDGTGSILTADHEKWGCFGNSFTLKHFDRVGSIDLCRCVVDIVVETDPKFLDAVADLHNRTLGCWCRGVAENDPACHSDILAEWADELTGENANDRLRSGW